MDHKIVDHLFRHEYGRMVAILTRLFGLTQLESIEDAVQDTFIKASLSWRNHMPENPQAWLIQAAKNRMIDLLRKIKAEKERFEKLPSGPSAIHLNDLFLEHEIQDSQLRMIFVACHPSLLPKEQIAFALKTISGFSMKEIAAALLSKEETVKKRLQRARAKIREKNIKFEIPSAYLLKERLDRVMEVIYLIFNEGFHSTSPNELVKMDLCSEALRLCSLTLANDNLKCGSLYAVKGLICFHSSRLLSKVRNGKVVDLQNQDRSTWNRELMFIGNDAMYEAMKYEDFSLYHLEAAIAAEHLKAKSFQETNWDDILHYYLRIQEVQDTPSLQLNIAMVYLHMSRMEESIKILKSLNSSSLGQRYYLLEGAFGEWYKANGQHKEATNHYNSAKELATNQLEKNHFQKKIDGLMDYLS